MHNYFVPGDEVEFDYSSLAELARATGFPESPWRAFVVEPGCNQLLVSLPGTQDGILAENCATFVRLISANRDCSKIRSMGCRTIRV